MEVSHRDACLWRKDEVTKEFRTVHVQDGEVLGPYRRTLCDVQGVHPKVVGQEVAESIDDQRRYDYSVRCPKATPGRQVLRWTRWDRENPFHLKILDGLCVDGVLRAVVIVVREVRVPVPLVVGIRRSGDLHRKKRRYEEESQYEKRTEESTDFCRQFYSASFKRCLSF